MIFKRKEILKHNSFLKCFNYMILICETSYLSPANTKQKWLEIFLFCLLAFVLFCFKVLYTNHEILAGAFTPLIAED